MGKCASLRTYPDGEEEKLSEPFFATLEGTGELLPGSYYIIW